MDDVWTIEVNLDDDPLSSCSWHLDYLRLTIKNNVRRSIHNEKPDRWVLVGIRPTFEDASHYADELRQLICLEKIKHGLESELNHPYCGIERALSEE